MATLAVRDMGATVAQHTRSQPSRDGQTAPSSGTGAFHGLGNYWEFVSSSVGLATKNCVQLRGLTYREGFERDSMISAQERLWFNSGGSEIHSA